MDFNKIIDLKNGFAFTFTDDRKWIWKAFTPAPLQKKMHGEKPQLEAVEDIEKVYKDTFDKCLANATKDITRYLIG